MSKEDEYQARFEGRGAGKICGFETRNRARIEARSG